MIGYFNLLSLSLGIFAWVLTLTYLVRYKKDDYKKWGLIVFLSMIFVDRGGELVVKLTENEGFEFVP